MITEIFCLIDDANPAIEQILQAHGEKPVRSSRGPKPTLCASEVITIAVLFHLSHYRNFKHFYNDYARFELRSAFPSLPTYRRFNRLYGRLYKYVFILAIMLTLRFRGVDVYAIDPTPLPVCNIKREHSHKVMFGLAAKSKSTMGWYYGLKLHLVVTSQGEIASFFVTPANCDERNEKVIQVITKGLSGYALGDKGYISGALTEELLKRGLRLLTPARKNMKNVLLPDFEAQLLRGRQVVESSIHILKDILHIQHTRHRSPLSFFMNLFAGLIAYAFYPNKPKATFMTVRRPDHETLQFAA